MIEGLIEEVQSLLQTLPVARIQAIVKEFTLWTKENPVVGGVVGIWLLGIISYWLRSVPGSLKAFIVRYFTVTVTLDNEDDVYYQAMKWFMRQGYAHKARTLRANNGDWGEDKEVVISPGYGNFVFWYCGWPYRMSKHKGESKNAGKVRESVEIQTLGHNQKAIRRLLSEFKDNEDKSGMMQVQQWKHSCWCRLNEQPARPMSTIVADQSVKDLLIDSIERFNNRQEWYAQCGIPYRMGIALHGVPGTGKTSMVLALCHHFQKRLHLINLNGMTDKTLQDAIADLDNNSIVLLEDVDTFGVTKERADGKSDKDGDGALTLSGLLNAIDGAVSSHGRILIMTTNHLDHLDEALRRPGRCDIVVEMGYLTNETAREMFKRFWPDFELDPSWELKGKITPAMFQGLALQSLANPRTVSEELRR